MFKFVLSPMVEYTKKNIEDSRKILKNLIKEYENCRQKDAEKASGFKIENIYKIRTVNKNDDTIEYVAKLHKFQLTDFDTNTGISWIEFKRIRNDGTCMKSITYVYDIHNIIEEVKDGKCIN